MALHWNWDEKCGEAIIEQFGNEYTLNLYEGNAYLIFLNEYKEDGKQMYSMYNFLVDKEHAKRCLGLARGKNYDGTPYTNLFTEVKKIRLDKAKCNKTAELVGMFAKAFDNIDIEIYTSD